MATLLSGAEAIELDYTDQILRVRACELKAKNAIKLDIGARGNASASIEGPLEETLQTSGIGFHRLRMGKTGWIEGYDLKAEAPAKHIPWLRVREVGVQQPVELGKLGDWVELVREANRVMHHQRHTIGRPTREMRQAEEVMRAFHLLAKEIIGPSLSDREMQMIIALGKRLEAEKD